MHIEQHVADARGLVACCSVPAVALHNLGLVLAQDPLGNVSGLLLLQPIERFRLAPDPRPQALRPQQHHPDEQDGEDEQSLVGELAEDLGQADDDKRAQQYAGQAAGAAEDDHDQHEHGQLKREAGGVDGPDAGGEERSREATPHAAHHIGEQLQAQRGDPDGFGGELVLSDRHPSAPETGMIEVLGEDHRDRKQGEPDDEKVSLRVELEAEYARPGYAKDPVRPAGVFPVVESDPSYLAESQRHDRQVVAAQPESRVAEDGSRRAGEENGQRHRGEEVPFGLGHQECARIGADRKEGGVPEVKQAGVADNDVEPEPEHCIGRDRHRHRSDVVVAVDHNCCADDCQHGDHARPERRTAEPIARGGVGASDPAVGQLCDHMRSATRSPKRPVGLTTSTVMRTPNTTTSSQVPERYPVV